MTNIVDPAKAPALELELAALYHERWEIESVFDEFKPHLRANSTVLRSKTPDLVPRELWGLLLAYFATYRFSCPSLTFRLAANRSTTFSVLLTCPSGLPSLYA